MSSSIHVDNKRKGILIVGEEPTQKLDDTTLAAVANYPTNFTQSGKRFVLSPHYNESTVSFLLMLQTYTSSKQKNLEQKIIHCV